MQYPADNGTTLNPLSRGLSWMWMCLKQLWEHRGTEQGTDWWPRSQVTGHGLLDWGAGSSNWASQFKLCEQLAHLEVVLNKAQKENTNSNVGMQVLVTRFLSTEPQTHLSITWVCFARIIITDPYIAPYSFQRMFLFHLKTQRILASIFKYLAISLAKKGNNTCILKYH